MTSLFLTRQSGSRELPKRILHRGFWGRGHTGARGKEDKRHEDGLPLLGGEQWGSPIPAAENPSQPAPQKTQPHWPHTLPPAEKQIALLMGRGQDPRESPTLIQATRESQQRAKHSHQHRALYLPQPNQLTPLLSTLRASPSLPRPPPFLGRAPPNQASAPRERAWDWRVPRQGGTHRARPLVQHSRDPERQKERGGWVYDRAETPHTQLPPQRDPPQDRCPRTDGQTGPARRCLLSPSGP